MSLSGKAPRVLGVRDRARTVAAPEALLLTHNEASAQDLSRMGVAFQVRGPGSLRLTVNGQGVALGCGYPSEIISCVPHQDIGETFSTWGYGLADAGTWFDSLPGLVVGQPVTITVHPSHFVGDDWRLGLEYLNR